jgi:hypothetical protein
MTSRVDDRMATSGRRPFILFLVGGALFIAAIMAALAYGMSRPRTAAGEAQERLAVNQCWRSTQDLAQSSSPRRLQEDACREMQTQFRGKYPDQS